MAQRYKLTATAVRNKKQRGMFNDGGGLYLRVTPSGTKSWMFRWRDNGRLRDMGLGPADCSNLRTVGASLTNARKAADEARRHVHARRDPKAERDREHAARRAESANTATFEDCVARYIRIHTPGWKSAKHAGQWRSTLETYAYPEIGQLAVRDIDTPHILRILEPIWATKTETATRVRQRIESVLDWAKVQGYCDRENPARWRGHLDKSLPKPRRVRRVRHHPALPYAEMAAFMRELAEHKGVAARCLEFTIYTAARTSESIEACWSEFDLDTGLWTVPPERIKSAREHRVPMSPTAMIVLKGQRGQDAKLVFPGMKEGRSLSNMAMLTLLQDDMGKSVTVHGFRSTFRDFAADCTNYPREIAEAALAHTLKDETEAAYRRSDLFEKRRKLMNVWAKYCTNPTPKVSSLRRQRHA